MTACCALAFFWGEGGRGWGWRDNPPSPEKRDCEGPRPALACVCLLRIDQETAEMEQKCPVLARASALATADLATVDLFQEFGELKRAVARYQPGRLFFGGGGGFEPTNPDKAHLETIIEARFAPPGFCNEGPASHHHSHHSPTISGALLFFPVPLCIFVSFFGG